MADNGCPSGDCGGTQNEDDDATNLLETTALLDGTPAASLSKDRRIGKGNNHNVDEKSSLWGCWLRNRYLLPIVATMNTPPYTMGICISLFSTAAYLSRDARTARTLLALYLVYCLGDPTPKRLQKPRWVRLVQKWCNDSWFFRWTAEHFPCCLHKTASIDACRGPYVFAYHPHGVIGMGVNMTLNTNARQFDALFPGVSEGMADLATATTKRAQTWPGKEERKCIIPLPIRIGEKEQLRSVFISHFSGEPQDDSFWPTMSTCSFYYYPINSLSFLLLRLIDRP